ncbi:MAG: hypothetical protein KDB53_14440 [Planctomycetes bacterium]|nr:hypothetical protein [Planctomycetota bacterium]
MGCEWSPGHYRDLVQRALDEGYRFPLVSEVGSSLPAGRLFLLRHDIDLSVVAAHAMAKIECALGVRTSYYVRLHAPWYNPGAVGELQLLTSIHAMGHEIGLHYEPRYFEALGRDVAAGIRGDIAHLEHQLGFKTKSVSQHEPTVGPLVETLPEGYPCAYQRHLVIDMPYFGDSGMKWREGCVCQKLGKLEQLHALIHPANWIRADEPWTEVLRHHAQDAGRRLEMLMEAHVEDQRIYLANRDRLDAERRARY